MIQFVANYDDLSTDKGYQFKFYCDKCRNGYVSGFVTSKVGMAGSVLRAAGHLLGGWAYRAGYGTHDLQQIIGGPEHDSALRDAMEQGKKYFHQCTKCGKWVCPEVCWNGKVSLCEDCAPNFEETVAAAQAAAKSQMVQEQIVEKARQVNYATDINVGKDVHYQAPSIAERPASTPACKECGADVDPSAKFCPQCGKPDPLVKAGWDCKKCGLSGEGKVKFCPNCGNKF